MKRGGDHGLPLHESKRHEANCDERSCEVETEVERARFVSQQAR